MRAVILWVFAFLVAVVAAQNGGFVIFDSAGTPTLELNCSAIASLTASDLTFARAACGSDPTCAQRFGQDVTADLPLYEFVLEASGIVARLRAEQSVAGHPTPTELNAYSPLIALVCAQSAPSETLAELWTLYSLSRFTQPTCAVGERLADIGATSTEPQCIPRDGSLTNGSVDDGNLIIVILAIILFIVTIFCVRTFLIRV